MKYSEVYHCPYGTDDPPHTGPPVKRGAIMGHISGCVSQLWRSKIPPLCALRYAEGIDAARTRPSQPLLPDPDDTFDAKDDSDLRQKQIVTVTIRRGQSSFRSGLLAAYAGRCCITGCDLVAAHISPYRGKL